MSEERSEDLSREERLAFDKLRGGTLPADSEDRVAAALRERNLVRSEPWMQRLIGRVPMLPRLALGLGAVALAFGLGVQYGKQAALPDPADALVEPAAPEETSDEGEVLAVLDEVDGKPNLAQLDNGDYGDFPPYPLDGESRFISPKSR